MKAMISGILGGLGFILCLIIAALAVALLQAIGFL